MSDSLSPNVGAQGMSVKQEEGGSVTGQGLGPGGGPGARWACGLTSCRKDVTARVQELLRVLIEAGDRETKGGLR